jgi:hypothetical protein
MAHWRETMSTSPSMRSTSCKAANRSFRQPDQDLEANAEIQAVKLVIPVSWEDGRINDHAQGVAQRVFFRQAGEERLPVDMILVARYLTVLDLLLYLSFKFLSFDTQEAYPCTLAVFQPHDHA